MPKILHYRHKCIGCGVCQQMQPEHWRMSKKDGRATLLHSVEKKTVFQAEVNEAELELIKAVIQACPVGVIKLG